MAADPQHTPAGRLTPEATAALLRSAQQARAHNNPAKARAILRALAERRPDDLRVWMLLATVAEDRIEQARAFERMLVLSPDHQVARRGLERLRAAGVPEVLPPAAPADARALTPPEDDGLTPVTLSAGTTAPEPAQRRPLLLGVGALAAVALAVLFVVRPWEQRDPQTQAPVVAVPALQPGTAGVPQPTAAAGSTPGAATTPAATAVPSPIPTPTPTPGLAIGQFVPAGIWRVSVLDRTHIRALDGSIGGQLQPAGRFVLALVTVVNSSSQPARLPRELLTLSDASGARYLPLPGASAVYLNSYGRGQFGDYSADENIPPNTGNVSVPLIFDVPERATGLELRVSTTQDGWAVR
ncbi:MAG TPA: hypothetical protein VFS21_23425 [Roseiflexaceae bacterium]|nr:hypothetical protein [Roseiflexaceae bacterium]